MKIISILRKCAAILALIVSAALVFEACAQEPSPLEGGGIVIMTTKATTVRLGVAGNGNIVIDWGDEKKSNLNDAPIFDEITKEFYFTHDYSGTTVHKIVITGNITKLTCRNIGLTALDVSRNTVLTYLTCDYNQLISLDVSKNTALTDLVCSRNHLTTLDVSRNVLLEWLNCEFNQLKNLDVRNNTELWMLTCGGNTLTAVALNDLFRTLPDRTEKDDWGSIYIDNPQNHDIDRSIAEKKKWDVSKQRF